MAYSSIGLLSIIIIAIINFDIFRKKPGNKLSPHDSAYRLFLISASVYYLVDLSWGIMYELHLLIATYIITVLYFLSMAVSVYFWTKYVIAYLRENNVFTRVMLWFGRLFIVFQSVVLFINCFVPIQFYFDDLGVYHPRRIRYLGLTMQIIIFLFTSVYAFITLRKRKNLAESLRPRYRMLGFFGLVMILFTVLQTYYAVIPMYAMGYLLGICLIHTFILEGEKEDHRKELERMLMREKEHKVELGNAQQKAYFDALTGAKNINAYTEQEDKINRRIEDNDLDDFAVVVFDLNDLKKANDTMGHDRGDKYIKDSCALISEKFNNNTVYRIGGDEFVTMLEGDDYLKRNELVRAFNEQIDNNLISGDIVVVACGISEYIPGYDTTYSNIFERADKKMYDRKRMLKE